MMGPLNKAIASVYQRYSKAMKTKSHRYNPKAYYKDVWRHYFVCDQGHRFHEDWDNAWVRSHGICRIEGCYEWTELEHSPADNRWGYEEVEVPVDAPVMIEAEHEASFTRLLDQVAAAAHRHFKEADLAESWLTDAHPALHNKTVRAWIDCYGEQGVSELLELLEA
jgi:hypothetical protein